MRPTVSDRVLEVLAAAGVRHMFGIPGDAINSLVEAVRKQDAIRFIQVRHEEAGAFAAAAQAKLSGELAVCVGTAGPGAVHLLNGLYDAKLDHAPVLAITGQVATPLLGSDYHQEVDLYTLFKDVAVFNHVVVNAEQIPGLAVRACQAALAQRGVAHLSLPVDVAAASAPRDDRRRALTGAARIVPCDTDLERAAELLNAAGRVAILAGAGAASASEPLVRVAETLRAPIIKTLKGKDILPDEHPFSLGGLGLLGTRPAVDAIDSCDALLLVGTDFPYHDFYPDGVPAVQIDVEADRLGKRYPVDVALRGHAHLALTELLERVDEKNDGAYLDSCRAAMVKWWERLDEEETLDGEPPIRPQAVARAVGAQATDDAIFLCDTGAVTVWCGRHLRLRGQQRFILSSSLASMAFAMPGGIGAQLAYPDRQVVALTGDGGFTMLMGDLMTAVKYELPITIVIFNNGKLGLIQMEQEVQGYPEFQTGLLNPDFALLARACGAEGWRVSSPGDLEGAIAEALACRKPSIVDVPVHPEERTMPPKVNVRQAFGYGLAKAREFFGSGDKEGGVDVLRELRRAGR